VSSTPPRAVGKSMTGSSVFSRSHKLGRWHRVDPLPYGGVSFFLASPQLGCSRVGHQRATRKRLVCRSSCRVGLCTVGEGTSRPLWRQPNAKVQVPHGRPRVQHRHKKQHGPRKVAVSPSITSPLPPPLAYRGRPSERASPNRLTPPLAGA